MPGPDGTNNGLAFHTWGSWSSTSNTHHISNCTANCGVAAQTATHNWGTCINRSRTCNNCGRTGAC